MIFGRLDGGGKLMEYLKPGELFFDDHDLRVDCLAGLLKFSGYIRRTFPREE
jgi:hypothetical protein